MSQQIEKSIARSLCAQAGGDPDIAITNDLAEPVTTWNWERFIPQAQAALTALREAGYVVQKEQNAPTREEFDHLKSTVDGLDKWVRTFVGNVQKRAADTGRTE